MLSWLGWFGSLNPRIVSAWNKCGEILILTFSSSSELYSTVWMSWFQGVNKSSNCRWLCSLPPQYQARLQPRCIHACGGLEQIQQVLGPRDSCRQVQTILSGVMSLAWRQQVLTMDVSNAPVIPPRKFSKSSKIVAKERWVVGVRPWQELVSWWQPNLPSVWIEPDA